MRHKARLERWSAQERGMKHSSLTKHGEECDIPLFPESGLRRDSHKSRNHGLQICGSRGEGQFCHAGIRFRRGLTVEKLESAIARLETHIRQKEPTIKKVFIEPDSLNQSDEEPPYDKHQ
jgi:hypothetical protein